METYLISDRKRLAPRHAREVVNLGVAGMLHDMGKLKLPEPLRTFTGVEPPEDAAQRADWESHVRLGYDLIRGGVVVDVKPGEPYAPIVKRLRDDGTGLVYAELDLSAPGFPGLETAGSVAVRPLLPENLAIRAA